MRKITNSVIPTGLVLGLALILVIPAVSFGATFYISNVGSDASPGTTEAAPWAHAPNACATGYPAMHKVASEDSFVFRGGDKFQIPCDVPLRISFDRGWYTGDKWTSPEFVCADPSCSN